MTRYLINSVRTGESDGGMACGPVSGSISVEARITTDKGEEFYMVLSETEGIPDIFKSPISLLDRIMDDEYDESWAEYHMDVGEYDEIFEAKDPEWFDLFRYLIYIVSADEEDGERFIKKTTGKYLDEITIPKSVVEEELEEE